MPRDMGNDSGRGARKGEATSAAIAKTADSPSTDRVPVLEVRPAERAEIRPRKEAASASTVELWQDPMPVWLSALLAVECSAVGSAGSHAVCWNWMSGRAVYSNFSGHSERIEPLGVTLTDSETLVVCWLPGETTYSLKVLQQFDQCA